MRPNYRRAFNIRALLAFEGVTLIVFSAGWLIGGFSGYADSIKPPMAINQGAFFAAWTAAHILSGLGAYIVWNAYDIDGPRVLRMYFIHIILGAVWPLLFFRLNLRLFSFFWIIMMIGAVTLVMTGFKYIRRVSYRLMIPHLLWLIYAAYINFGSYLLNT